MSGPRIRTLSAVLAGLGLAVLTGCSPAVPAGRGATAATTATPTPTAPASFTVVANGDVLIHQGGALVTGAAAAARAQGTDYDFSGVFAAVAPVIDGADLAICHTEYDSDPSPAQTAIAEALLASPDIDLVLGHHAHVVQPMERINGKWVAYGLGNHIAQQTRPVTYDSVIARFTFTRGPDGRYAVAMAEAIPTHIRPAGDGLAVVPTHSGEPAYERVAEVVTRRGGADAGLVVTDR